MSEFNDYHENGYYSKKSEDIVQDETRTANENDYNTENFGGYNYNTTPPVVPQKKPKKYGLGAVILASILAAVIGAGSAIGVLTSSLGFQNSGNTTSSSIQSYEGANVNITVDEETASIAEAVAKKCAQSVVGIRTTTSVRNFFGGSEESKGEGSGVVYTADGYIITNYHVIEGVVEAGSGKVEVYVGSLDSTPYTATIIGYHISSDLAVLKIDAKGLKPVEFENSDNLTVGQYAITIGAPGGLEFMGSVTYGIISGLDRIVSTSQSVPLIQTDAAINPGNSGGALLNSDGLLIGINSSKIVAEEFEGMGFAIPSNVVKEKVDKIISKKDEDEPYIGVSISEKYSSQVLSYYGYPSGAVVTRVESGSPAEKAGIARGDIITKFNDKAVTEYNILGELLNDCDIGQTVNVEIYRNGSTKTLKLTIGSNSN